MGTNHTTATLKACPEIKTPRPLAHPGINDFNRLHLGPRPSTGLIHDLFTFANAHDVLLVSAPGSATVFFPGNEALGIPSQLMLAPHADKLTQISVLEKLQRHFDTRGSMVGEVPALLGKAAQE